MWWLPIFYAIISLLPSKIGTHANLITTTNTFSCPQDKKCVFVDHCPDIFVLIKRNQLPIHQFRQAICGYSEMKLKVCCDVPYDYSFEPGSQTFDQNIKPLLATKSNHKCGRGLIDNNIDLFGLYPFLARIGFINLYTGNVKYPCNGIIINERTVMTTASCALATSEKYKLYSVLVGEFDMETNPDCNSLFCGHKIQFYNISYVVKYPNYHPESFTHNIALLRLKEPINFTVTAQPICLFPRKINIDIHANVILVGWGKLLHQKSMLSKQQQLQMKLLPRQHCSNFLNQELMVELCIIGEEQPCSGYSGSPLLYKYLDTYFLIGILSYGSNCNTKTNFPLVFVDVQRYTRWIIENS